MVMLLLILLKVYLFTDNILGINFIRISTSVPDVLPANLAHVVTANI